MKILSGDWPSGSAVVLKKSFSGTIKTLMVQKGTFSFDKIPIEDIQSAELVTAENHMSVGRKLGWGLGGALLLGPVGAAIGAVAGGNVKEQIVAIVLKDGRKLMVKGSRKEIAPILAVGYQWPGDQS